MSKIYYPNNKQPAKVDFDSQRLELLDQLEELTDAPFNLLSVVWLGLVVVDYTTGLNSPLEIVFYFIWGFFILHFIIEFLLAPSKRDYLKNHMLTLVSLFIPSIRIFRIFRSLKVLRAARAIRSVNLVQIVTSLNRGMKSLRSVMGSRGIGYIAALTLIIVFAGSAAFYYFENTEALSQSGYTVEKPEINSYGDALWFTSMIIVTIGSEYWPVSTEGRILTFLLSLYAFAIFGYITATVASFILGKKIR